MQAREAVTCLLSTTIVCTARHFLGASSDCQLHVNASNVSLSDGLRLPTTPCSSRCRDYSLGFDSEIGRSLCEDLTVRA